MAESKIHKWAKRVAKRNGHTIIKGKKGLYVFRRGQSPEGYTDADEPEYYENENEYLKDFLKY